LAKTKISLKFSLKIVVTSKTAINQNGHDRIAHTPKWPQSKAAKNQTKTATMLVNIICNQTSTLNYNVNALM